MEKSIGISTKLVLIVCLCVGLALAATTFISLDLFKADAIRRAKESNAELAQVISGQAEQELSGAVEIIQRMSKIVTDYSQTHAGAPLPLDAQNKVSSILGAEDNLMSFGVFKPNAKGIFTEVFFTAKNQDLAEFELSPTTLKTASLPNIAKLLSTQSDRLLVYNDGPLLKKTVITLASFKKVAGQKEPWLFKADLRPDALLRFLAKKPGLTSYIINSQGSILVHPDPQMVLHPTSVSGTALSEAMVDDENKVKGAGSAEFTGEKGKLFVGAFKTLKIADLSVVVQGDRAKVVALTHRLKYRLLLAGIFIACFAFTLAFLFSNSLIVPLRSLFQNIEKINLGLFDAMPEIKSHDEIGIIAFSFRKMSTLLQERDRLKNTLTKLPTVEMTDKVLSGEMKLPTEKKIGTVLVCTLRDSSDFGDNLRADEVIRYVSEFQTEVIKAIQKNQGVVDKATGHSIKGVWGGLVPSTDGGFNAVLSALEIRRVMKSLNQRRVAKRLPEIGFNIGIHTGEMVAGHVGLDARSEYMFVGEAVDMAGRTEIASRMLRSDIAVSDKTFSSVKNRSLIYGHPTPVEVAGTREPITVYEVIGRKKSDGLTESDLTRTEQEAIMTGLYHPSQNTQTSVIASSKSTSYAPPSANSNPGHQTNSGSGYRFDLTGAGMSRSDSVVRTAATVMQPQPQAPPEPDVVSAPPAPPAPPVVAPIRPSPVAPSPFNVETVQMPMARPQSPDVHGWYLMRDAQSGVTEGPFTLGALREMTSAPGFYFEQAYAYRQGDSYMTPLMQVPGLSRRSARPPERVAPPPPPPQAPLGRDEWFVSGSDGSTFGPYSFEQLGHALDVGQITRTTYCWHQGMGQWVFAYQVPGLDRRQNGPPSPPIPIGRIA